MVAFADATQPPERGEGNARSSESGSGDSGIAGILRGFTRDGLNQIINRGIRPYEIVDALRNPLKVVPGSADVTRYIGRWAELRVNSLGELVTAIRYKRPGAP